MTHPFTKGINKELFETNGEASLDSVHLRCDNYDSRIGLGHDGGSIFFT